MKIKFRSQNLLQKRNKKSYTLIKNMTLDTEVESGDVIQKSADKVNTGILGAFFLFFLIKDGKGYNIRVSFMFFFVLNLFFGIQLI